MLLHNCHSNNGDCKNHSQPNSILFIYVHMEIAKHKPEMDKIEESKQHVWLGKKSGDIAK